jgi:hypothetical protein
MAPLASGVFCSLPNKLEPTLSRADVRNSSKTLGRIPGIVLQQAAQSFATLDRALARWVLVWGGQQHDVPLALMRALLMIMGHVLLKDMGEGAFAKEDELRQTLLFH